MSSALREELEARYGGDPALPGDQDAMMFAEGFDDALIGTAEVWAADRLRTVAAYDTAKMLGVLGEAGRDERGRSRRVSRPQHVRGVHGADDASVPDHGIRGRVKP